MNLLKEIGFDLMVCKLEGWSMEDYVKELKSLIDECYRKVVKEKNRKSIDSRELKIEFK